MLLYWVVVVLSCVYLKNQENLQTMHVVKMSILLRIQENLWNKKTL